MSLHSSLIFEKLLSEHPFLNLSDNNGESMAFNFNNPAPDFTLPDQTGRSCILSDRAKGLLGITKHMSSLLETEGKIVKIYPEVKPGGHAAEVMRI